MSVWMKSELRLEFIGTSLEVDVGFDEPDHIHGIRVTRKDDVGAVLIEHDGLDLSEGSEPAARVLSALVRTALEWTLLPYRDLGFGEEGTVHVDDAVDFGMLLEDDALTLSAHRRLEAVGDDLVITDRFNLHETDLRELVEVGLAT